MAIFTDDAGVDPDALPHVRDDEDYREIADRREEVRVDLREARDRRDELAAEWREKYGGPTEVGTETRETSLEAEVQRALSGEAPESGPRAELENDLAEAEGEVRRLEDAMELLTRAERTKRKAVSRRLVVGAVDQRYRELLGEAVQAGEELRAALETVEAFEETLEERGIPGSKLNPPDIRAADVDALLQPLRARREEEIPPPPSGNGAGAGS